MQDHRAKGFTLVELSALMVVFGIMAAIAVAGTSHLVRSTRLSGTTNTLLGDLRYAHTLATTECSEFQIRFVADGYSIVRVSPLRTALTRKYPTGVSLAASDTANFYAWGLVSPVTLTITGSSGSKVVQLAASGNVTRE
jgi:prepilin-type N-terminal cleavage/methylation domain-containing protein